MPAAGWAMREIEEKGRGSARARRESVKRALRAFYAIGNRGEVQKKQLAETLGISRWTLDRYMAEIETEDNERGRGGWGDEREVIG